MSYLSSRTDFESCLLHFHNETQSCSESEQWTWEMQSMVSERFFLPQNLLITSLFS
jgi:hypothetical protein